MDLVEYFEEVATELGWGFHYGRRDFQNLVEAEANKNHLFLDPVTRSGEYSDAGYDTMKTEYTAKMMILSIADFDQEYNDEKGGDANSGKWKLNIKPKIDKDIIDFEKAILCSNNWLIKSRQITDAINVFEDNLDGIIVNYKIMQYR